MKDYLHELNDKLRQGDATEHTFRPVLESLLKRLSKDSVVTNEPKRIKVGAPDFVIRRIIGKTQFLPIGYIETKDIGVDLTKLEKDDQISRYLKLENLLLTDYVTFRWYVDGKFRAEAVLAKLEKGKLKPLTDGPAKVEELIQQFLSHKPLPITKPEELARRMAALCKQIDRIIVQSFDAKEASDLLSGLKDAFERTLLPDLTEAQFADMFTQTLAYGLFAARIHHYNSPSIHRGARGGEFRRSEAAKEIPKTNPFLRKLFDTINSTEIEDEPFIGFVDDLTAIMNHADIASILQFFGKRTGQEDPIVHFYETFLAAYDPKLRELRGVYYTPEPVVSYIVRSVDILLKEKFGLKDGLADRSTIEVEVEENGQKVIKTMPRVLILDPACGTGTFLYHVIKLIRQRFMDTNNAGEWSDFVQKHLLPRIYGFELLMAPYAVAHLKLAMQLAGQDLDEPQRSQYAYDFSGSERLNVYMTNSLEMTEKKVKEQIGVFERFLMDEAVGSRRIKNDLPIMVIMGNPPYSNFGMMNRGLWIRMLLDDYKKGLSEKKLNLDDDFIKFIRFGQWRIDETGEGILAYISNNTYIDGITHRRMRESLLMSFNDIFVLDLHGNIRKKETTDEKTSDQNVFDIMQGVAVGLFIKTQKNSASYSINVAEIRGSRQEKYNYLSTNSLATTDWRSLIPNEPEFPFVPRCLDNKKEYEAGHQLSEIFPIFQNGVKSDRDDLFVDFDQDMLKERIIKFFSEAGLSTEFVKNYRIEDSSSYDLLSRRSKTTFDEQKTHQILYRPFDQRWIYYSPGLTSRPAWQVMQHMIKGRNIALITTRQTRDCWSVLATNLLCGHKSVAAYDINSVFPLFHFPSEMAKEIQDVRRPNLSPAFLDEFSAKLGLTFVEDAPGFRRGKDTTGV